MRQYIKRTVGLTWGDVFIQVNPYVITQDVIDGEGLFGEEPFDSFAQMLVIARWSHETAQPFLERVKEMVETK